jgi:hypothetical protein
MKLPASPLDQRDRHVLASALVVALAVLFVLVFCAAAAGLAVRTFAFFAWGG